MIDLLLSEGSTIKAKEAGNFAFCITDVVVPERTARVGAVACLAGAGIYTTEGDLVHDMDGSDSRNERMIIKAVGHLGDSSHKYNLVSISQLAGAWPASRTISSELFEISAYAYTEGGQAMANVGVLSFGGALSLEVAYVAGINLVSNIYTAECAESFTRFLLYPTIFVSIIHGLAELEKQWFDKQNALANDSGSPVTQRNAHKEKAERSRTRLQAMGTLAAAPGELYQMSQGAIELLDVDGTLDATARPTHCAEEGMNRARTSLANAFKSESGLMTVLQRTGDITAEQKRLGGKSVTG